MPDVLAAMGEGMIQDTPKRTCFSCVHVGRIENRRDMCHCLLDHDEEDAEVIYSPASGVCPSWESAAEEIRRWQERWYGK